MTTGRATRSNTYEVEAVTLGELVKRVGVAVVDLIKLDLEGAEYELLSRTQQAEFAHFKQMFVEFHHRCTGHDLADTKATVQKLRRVGFQSFTLDGDNYLFYRK